MKKSRLFDIEFQSRVRSEEEENAFLAYTSLTELDHRLFELHSNLKPIIIFEAPAQLFASNDQILGKYFGQHFSKNIIYYFSYINKYLGGFLSK